MRVIGFAIAFALWLIATGYAWFVLTFGDCFPIGPACDRARSTSYWTVGLVSIAVLALLVWFFGFRRSRDTGEE